MKRYVMNDKKQKITTLITVGVLMMAVLTGCGSGIKDENIKVAENGGACPENTTASEGEVLPERRTSSEELILSEYEEVIETFHDDLNFDGYSDFEVITYRDEDGISAGEIYLWNEKKQQYEKEGIPFHRTYVVHEEEKAFSLVGGGEKGESEIICRIDEKNEIEELRSYTLNRQEGFVQIWDAREARFLIKENVGFNEEGRPLKDADYQAILWGNLPGSDVELKSYFQIAAADYEVELKDLIPGKSLQLVIHRKKEPDLIARVYHAGVDYEKPTEFTAVGFEDLLGRDGFYIYKLYYGMFPYTYYYALEGDKLIEIAGSWGNDPAQSNFMVDVDGDGDRELICNVIYMADGGRQTLLYHYDGVEISQGFCMELLDEEYDNNYGVGSASCEYLPEENRVRISFWKDALNDFDTKDYKIWLDKMTLTPYNGEE